MRASSAEGGNAPATSKVVFIPLPDVLSLSRRKRRKEPVMGHLLTYNQELLAHGRAITGWMYCRVWNLGVVAALLRCLDSYEVLLIRASEGWLVPVSICARQRRAIKPLVFQLGAGGCYPPAQLSD